jgi:hypothetical protein
MWGCVSASCHLARAWRKWDREGETHVYTSNQSYFITNRRKRCCGGRGLSTHHSGKPIEIQNKELNLKFIYRSVFVRCAKLAWPGFISMPRYCAPPVYTI